jgi:hypothetical protein
LAGPFFTDLVIFQSLDKKNKNQKFVTRNPGDTMGISGYGSFFCFGPSALVARGRMFTEHQKDRLTKPFDSSKKPAWKKPSGGNSNQMAYLTEEMTKLKKSLRNRQT